MGRYKYMLKTAPDRLTLQDMKKRPNEADKEYAIRWKNVASIVRPPLTSLEENFIFVDTLPSPYYDMLVINAFVEFENLMYSVGRIEDGIKRGRIVDTRASMREKKRIVLDEHVQAIFREERRKRRSQTTQDESVVDFPFSLSYAQIP